MPPRPARGSCLPPSTQTQAHLALLLFLTHPGFPTPQQLRAAAWQHSPHTPSSLLVPCTAQWLPEGEKVQAPRGSQALLLPGPRRAHPPPKTSLWGRHSPSFFQTLAVTRPPLHLQTHALPGFQGPELGAASPDPSPLGFWKGLANKKNQQERGGWEAAGVPTALVPTLPHHGSPWPLPPEGR